MKPNTVNAYADMANRYDGMHLADAQAGEARREKARSATLYTLSETGTNARPMTLGWAMYKRFVPGATYVTVTTLDGKIVELTRRQADVLDLARSYIDGESTTMRQMATILACAPSTVWRALVKLTAYGLIAYITMRGHYGGTFMFSRGKNDALGHLQKAAKAKVQKWSEATKARFARLRDSVASMYSMKEIGGRGRVTDFYSVSTHMVATMERPWTPDDLRESGII
jgi:DNA-binding transcriptional regulator YhcF (GntR family)